VNGTRHPRGKLSSLLSGLLAVALASAVLSGEPAAPSPLALFGTVIDGTGRPPIVDGVVLVDSERVVAVGERDDVDIPADARIYEWGEATILPGFINAHVDNTTENVELLVQWAQAGVTTVRDLGAPTTVSWWLRNRSPLLAGVVRAGPIVTVPKGYPIVPNGFRSIAVTNPDDAHRKVEALIRQGADLVKIALESGEGPTLTPEERSAVVEVAHAHGLPVSVHATRLPDLQQAVAAGVDDIAHMVQGWIPDDLLQEMVKKGIAWVPTLAAEGPCRDTLRRFLDAGEVVGVGNDTGYLGFDEGMPMDELRALSRAGLTPMEILVAATRDAARILRRTATIGTLEQGKQADVLVVRGDPLQDLEVLLDPVFVLHRGVVVRGGGRPTPRGLRGCPVTAA